MTPTCADVLAVTSWTSELVQINTLLTIKREREVGDQLAAPLPFPGFMEIIVTSEGSQSRQRRAARQATPRSIREEEKYHERANNIPKEHAKRAAFVCVCSSHICNLGCHKIDLFLCVAYDLSLFVPGVCSTLCSWIFLSTKEAPHRAQNTGCDDFLQINKSLDVWDGVTQSCS